jgi:NADPH:quinone reductase-like Zn-dependent oxidoreductase
MSTAAHPTVPATCLEIRSTVTDDGTVTMAIREADVAEPADHEVTVRIEAAPINPSDLGTMLAGADLSTATASDGDTAGVRAQLSPAALAAQAGRLGIAVPCGNEGGGVVVAAGASPDAQALVGRTVGFISGNSYAQYRNIAVDQCFPMPDGTTSEQAAAPFVNPLTALGMVETMRDEGHTALVHTVGASNLGLMLNRVCQADGVGLVNIVRKPEHVDLLRGLGAEHVVDSSADSFGDDLVGALAATGATIAFDAIGGGELASTLLSAMERVASSQGGEFSRYGSATHKQVYIYGGLDRSPTTLRRDFGMSWGLGGWLLRPFLARIGDERADRLRQRVADEITTTFASSYGDRLSLADAVDPDRVQRYAKMTTGDKALVTPHA